MQSTARSSPASPSPPPWSPSTERKAILAFWFFLAALEVVRRVLDPFQPEDAYGLVAYFNVVSYALWALLTPMVFRLARRFPLEHGLSVRWMVVHLGFGLAMSFLVELFNVVLVVLTFWIGEVDPPHQPPNFRSLSPVAMLVRFWFLDDFVIYLAVLVAGFVRNHFIRLRRHEQEAARLQAEAASLQAQLADARLSALRMQLNPHFLFNTLHTVSSLADEDPEGVQRIVARLSALLRRALEGTARQEVPLSEELSFLRDYLEIQRVRFQGRLEVSEEIDPNAMDALVPNLLLQPLVENAVKHGSGQATGAVGRIVLYARRDAAPDRLVLAVRDNGPGLAEGAEATAACAGRVGLANTRERLHALYGADAALDLRAAPEGGLAVTVTLPYHTAADLRSAVNV